MTNGLTRLINDGRISFLREIKKIPLNQDF